MAEKKEEAKELSEAELVEAAQKINKDKETKFITEYNALCEKYGMQIQPQLTLTVARNK